MKAILFDGAGEADVIRVIEEEMPELRPDDVIVRVHAAGVNRADILQRQGYYGVQPQFGDSVIPGLEIAGEIVEVGHAVKQYKEGDRVMAIVGGGGYAEFARVNARMCIPIPESLSYVQAAAVPEVFVTAHEALIHLGELQADQWALVHAAAGGVGTAVIQLAHATGANTVFTASDQNRIERVKTIGGTIGVNYKTQDFLGVAMEVTNERGVDVVIDFVGGSYLDRNLRSLAQGGRLIEVGALGGGEGVLPLGFLIHQHLRIIGTVMKSRSLEEKVSMVQRFCERWLDAFAAGRLKPIVDSTFRLEDTAEAHRYMEASRNFGKIVLTLD